MATPTPITDLRVWAERLDAGIIDGNVINTFRLRYNQAIVDAIVADKRLPTPEGVPFTDAQGQRWLAYEFELLGRRDFMQIQAVFDLTA